MTVGIVELAGSGVGGGEEDNPQSVFDPTNIADYMPNNFSESEDEPCGKYCTFGRNRFYGVLPRRFFIRICRIYNELV